MLPAFLIFFYTFSISLYYSSNQSPKRFLECIAVPLIKSVAGGYSLAQKLGELAQLEDRGRGIIAEITLRQRPKPYKLGVVHF